MKKKINIVAIYGLLIIGAATMYLSGFSVDAESPGTFEELSYLTIECFNKLKQFIVGAVFLGVSLTLWVIREAQ